MTSSSSSYSYSSSSRPAVVVVPPTIFVDFSSMYGLGNRLEGVASLTAVARASGRGISVYGAGLLWAPYWQSRFSSTARPTDDSLHGPPNKTCLGFFETPDCIKRLVSYADEVASDHGVTHFVLTIAEATDLRADHWKLLDPDLTHYPNFTLA